MEKGERGGRGGGIAGRHIQDAVYVHRSDKTGGKGEESLRTLLQRVWVALAQQRRGEEKSGMPEKKKERGGGEWREGDLRREPRCGIGRLVLWECTVFRQVRRKRKLRPGQLNSSLSSLGPGPKASEAAFTALAAKSWNWAPVYGVGSSVGDCREGF